MQARDLDGVLDGLRAGVEERRTRRARYRRERPQPFGELDVALVRDHGVVRVEEPRALLLHSFDDTRVSVTHVDGADSAGEIDEAIAVDVGDRRSLRLGCEHRQVHVFHQRRGNVILGR